MNPSLDNPHPQKHRQNEVPTAIQADRGLIQALILQGFTPSQVSQKTGVKARTIATWAKRYGWNQARQQTATILKSVKSPDLAVKVAQASTRVRQSLADDLERQADSLRQRKPGRKIGEALARAELAKKLADASDRVFQWSQQSATQLVQVETLLDLETRPTVSVSPGSNATQPAIAESSDMASIPAALPSESAPYDDGNGPRDADGT